MAWRMVEGETPLQTQPTQNAQEQPITALSEFQRIGSNLGLNKLAQLPGASYGAAGLEGLNQLGMMPFRAIGSLLGKPVSAEEEKAGTPASIYSLMSPETRQQMQPTNWMESLGQDVASRLPASLLFGASPTTAVLTSTAGPVARRTVENIPYINRIPGIGTAADIGSSVGTGMALQNKVPKTLEGTKQLASEEGKLQASKFSTLANKVNKAVSEVDSALGTEVDDTIKNSVRGALKTIDDNITNGTLNVKKGYDLSTSLNAMIKRYPNLKKYLVPPKNALKDIIKDSGIENWKNWSQLSDVDKIHIFQNTERWMSDLVPGLGKLGWSMIPKLPTWVLAKTADGIEYGLRAMANGPVRKHYVKLMLAGLETNPAAMIKPAEQLIKVSEKYNLMGPGKEQETEDQPKKVGKWSRVD